MPAKHPVRTTEKSLEIIKELNTTDVRRVTALSERLEISKSSVHNHLSTLEEHGYVVKENGKYRLSLKFLQIGGSIRSQMKLFTVAEPEVNELAEETGEMANLMVEERGLGVYLYRSKGDKAVALDTYAGMMKHLHSTALGKAILSKLPKKRVEEIIDTHGLPAITEDTITNKEELYESLVNIRDRGYSIDDEEAASGARCVAAPIDYEDTVIGAISISAPVSRLDGDRFESKIPEIVKSSANVVELNIKYG